MGGNEASKRASSRTVSVIDEMSYEYEIKRFRNKEVSFFSEGDKYYFEFLNDNKEMEGISDLR